MTGDFVVNTEVVKEEEKLTATLGDFQKKEIKSKLDIKDPQKELAREEAKRQGLKLGRWEGSFAKIKNGAGWFHLHTMTIVEERPGKP